MAAVRNLDPIHRTLCRLLATPADADLTSSLHPDDWHLLATTAWHQGVAPLLYHALKRAGWPTGVPPDVQADLRQAYYATTTVNILVYRELARLLAALATAETPTDHRPPTADSHTRYARRNVYHASLITTSAIPAVVLKGAALATTLYRHIGLRPLGDLDLLVPEECLIEAVARLKALGYVEPYPEMAPGFNAMAGHHVHLQGGLAIRVAVELHWTLIGGEHDWRTPSLPWFWSQTEALTPTPRGEGVRGALSLNPTAHLLYLCAHLMLQHGEAHAPLRWFYDIYLLVKREGWRIRWDELVARAREFHWAPAVHATLEGTRDRFVGPVESADEAWLPLGVLEALVESPDRRASRLVARRADPLQTRATGVMAAASALSAGARLRLLLAITMPSPAYMRWRYKPRPAWLWPLYYPYRWFDILREGLTTLWRMASSRWQMGMVHKAHRPDDDGF